MNSPNGFNIKKFKSILKNMFKHNRLLFNEINNSPVISDINNDFYQDKYLGNVNI